MLRPILSGILLASVCFGQVPVNNNFTIAPQIIREGVLETIALNLHGVDGRVDVVASLNLNGITEYSFDDQDAARPILMQVMYEKPPDAQPTSGREFVGLIVTVRKAGINIHTSTLKMRLVENSGYLYVQTDRPIYRPEETAKIRIAALTQEQFPDTAREVEMVIRIPLDKVAVEKKKLRMSQQNFIETDFSIPEFPEYGVWSVQVRFLDQNIIKWSTINFEVRRYVLPTFNVRIELDNPNVVVKANMSDAKITGKITSQYSYGKAVSGSFFLMAKLKRPDLSPIQFHQFPDDIEKTASIINGRALFSIKVTDYLTAFPEATFSELEDEGASIIIEASVTDDAQGTVEAEISSPIPFVSSPYTLDLSRMSKYYTPGISFEMKIDVLNKVTEKPVPGVTLVVTGPVSCGSKKCSPGQCCTSTEQCMTCTADQSSQFASIFEKQTDENGQINLKVNMDADAVTKQYLIETRDDHVDDENEAEMTLTLLPYTSDSHGVLQLSATEKIATVGVKNFEIDVWYRIAPTELRYFIIARGAILSSGIHVPPRNVQRSTMKISIESDMVPSFKVFAYYLESKHNELVANSLWIDVKDVCNEEITSVFPEQVFPGQNTTFIYTGSPGTIVGISAVDRAAYFLYGESRLTRKDFFENLNQYDRGCFREGGENAQHVFEVGGFQVVGGIYVAKEDFFGLCEEANLNRAKRSAEDNAQIEAKFDAEAKIMRCIFDGKIDNLAGDDCKTRAERVGWYENPECVAAFLKSCKEQTRLKLIGRSGARSAGNNAENAKNIARKRSNFQESMIWTTEVIDKNGLLAFTKEASHSITTFEFDTISMHSSNGFCVAPTKNMRIFKNIFVQLKVPYSLKRREQTEIRATVFNYGEDVEKVKVMVKMGEDICSRFPQGKLSEVMTLTVQPESAETTSFTILPLRVPKNEKVEIEVQAFDENNNLLDHIVKWILVQLEGEVKDIKGTRVIDLRKKNSESFEIELRFPEKYTLGSRQCWLYPYSNFMGPIIEFDLVTKQPTKDIKNLIQLPHGCGEQNMVIMGPTVYAHRYLLSVGKMLPGSEEEVGSIDKMKKGYANQFSHRCNHCTPKVWSVRSYLDPSVWLNAYVNKAFAEAKVYYKEMEVTTICSSVGWLTLMQKEDGRFEKGWRIASSYMHGAVGSALSLTAYVMISLVESKSLCSQYTSAVESAIANAMNYLEANEHNQQMEQPYALSLVCYALSVYKVNDPFAKKMRTKLLSKMQYSDKRLAFWKGAPLEDIVGTGTHDYWYRNRPLAIDVEATGYALLSLLLAEKAKTEVSQEFIDTSRKIVLWLIEQRDEKGGFTTTQDTVVGLQALSEYMIWSNEVDRPDKNISIDLEIITASGIPIRRHLNESNENVTDPISLPDEFVGQNISVEANGTGEGTLSYRCIYHTSANEESCHYDLEVSTSVYGNNINTFLGNDSPAKMQILIKVSKPRGLKSGQSIIDVNLISGYEPDKASLEKINRENYVDGPVERFETANQKVILYLSEITATPVKLAFVVERAVPVKNPEPSSVTVYDYYEPSVRCRKFYAVPGDMPDLRTTPCEDQNVEGGEDMCKCAEGGCLKCRTRKEQREKTNCLFKGKCEICKEGESACFNMTAMACKGAYAYAVHIQRGVTVNDEVFVDFVGQVTTVYKRGPDTLANDGKNEVRNFITRSDCHQRCVDPALEKPDKQGNVNSNMMQTNFTVLIIGSSYEENVDKNNQRQRLYHLGEKTYMERIYPRDRCSKAKDEVDSKVCKKKAKKQTDKQKKKCKREKAIYQSCENLIEMRKLLRRGCDTV